MNSDLKNNKPIILWANKVDDYSNREVSLEEGLTLAWDFNSWYMEMSAIEGTNIHELFVLASELHKDGKNGQFFRI